MRRPFACMLCLLTLAGCGSAIGDDDGAGDGDAGPRFDATPPAPLVQQDYAGTYAYAGVWDLSSPFAGDGLGGFIAELLIEEVVSLAGVPDALADEAHDLISAQLRPSIVDAVNQVVPPELYGSSPLLTSLQAIFSAVAVQGTLTLTAGADPDDLAGTDTVSGLAVTYDTVVIPVPMAQLLGGAVTVAGDFAGGATGASAISIGAHALEIRFGQLVAIVAREALDVDIVALSDQALAVLSCPDLVAAITGGAGSYSISVGGSDFSVPASSLEDACTTMRQELVGQVLGMLRPDTGLSLGGPAALGDADADRVTETVTAGPSYGGELTGLPIPVALHVSAAFTAAR